MERLYGKIELIITFAADSLSFLEADIRVTMDSVTATSGDLPYTWHSGKCGVAGNYITIPSGYLDVTKEELEGKPKVQSFLFFNFQYKWRWVLIKNCCELCTFQFKPKDSCSNGPSHVTVYSKSTDFQTTICCPIFTGTLPVTTLLFRATTRS